MPVLQHILLDLNWSDLEGSFYPLNTFFPPSLASEAPKSPNPEIVPSNAINLALLCATGYCIYTLHISLPYSAAHFATGAVICDEHFQCLAAQESSLLPRAIRFNQNPNKQQKGFL